MPPPTVTAVLWDIDGTLMRTGGVAARAFLDAVEEVTGRRPDPTGLDFGGRLDPDIAGLLVAGTGADAALVPDVLARLEELVTERFEELRTNTFVHPGVRELSELLAGAGIHQTVVTGNITPVAHHKLAAAELVPPLRPEWGGYGESAPDRPGVAKVALAALATAGWAGTPESVWVIGDTPRDLACARGVGARCALVATGRATVEDLAPLGADLVLPDLATAHDLLALWGIAVP